jgi:hypothetical protein
MSGALGRTGGLGGLGLGQYPIHVHCRVSKVQRSCLPGTIADDFLWEVPHRLGN